MGVINITYQKENYWNGEEWYWDTVYESPVGEYYTSNALKFIRDNIGNKGIDKILDIGGGAGRIAIPLHKDGYEVDVLDIDNDALKLLKERECNIKTILGDIRSFNPDTKYDCIIRIGTIKYLDNFDDFLESLSPCLAKDGYVVLELLNPRSFRRIIAKTLRKTKYSTEIPPKVCAEKLHSHGYKLLSKKGSYWLVPTSNCHNNIIVKIASIIEKILLLNHIVSLSPQYYICGRKCTDESAN
jgi:ubiquinone/menaquinone biosynthesis C-methylase UbiE